jgi:hypothetical protein
MNLGRVDLELLCPGCKNTRAPGRRVPGPRTPLLPGAQSRGPAFLKGAPARSAAYPCAPSRAWPRSRSSSYSRCFCRAWLTRVLRILRASNRFATPFRWVAATQASFPAGIREAGARIALHPISRTDDPTNSNSAEIRFRRSQSLGALPSPVGEHGKGLGGNPLHPSHGVGNYPSGRRGEPARAPYPFVAQRKVSAALERTRTRTRCVDTARLV